MVSFLFEGNNKRIYEVPDGALGIDYSRVSDPNGFWIYEPIGDGEPITRARVQSALWSRFQDYQTANPWTSLPLVRSGGGFRGLDELGNSIYDTVSYTLDTTGGWAIVPANYPHELILEGNLFSNGAESLIDRSRLTTSAVVVRLVGADSLLTYRANSGGALTPTQEQQLADLFAALASPGIFSQAALANASNGGATASNQSAILNAIAQTQDILDILGYSPGNAVTINADGTITTANGKRVTVSTTGSTTTITRSDL